MEKKRIFIIFVQLCIVGLFSLSDPVVSNIPPVCQYPWQQYDAGNQAACFWLSNEKATWLDAMSWCKLMDGQLVELKSHTLNDYLTRMIKRKKAGKYWIGLTNVENDLTYRWMTSKQTHPIHPIPLFFKPGIPLTGQAKHCVNMDDKGEWNVDDCYAKFWFICQKIFPSKTPTKV